MRLSIWLTALVAVAILVVTGYFRPGDDAAELALVGKPARLFSLTTLDNQTVALADQKGKVVVLNFWTTWCPGCKYDLPHVQNLSDDKYRVDKGLVVWAINGGEDQATASKFIAENKYTFAVLMDTMGRVSSAYTTGVIPTTVIIGRDGIIKSVFVGYNDDVPPLVSAAIDKALGEPAIAPALGH